MLGAVAAPRAKRADEHLRRHIFPGPVSDPPHDIAPHRQPMALEQPGEQSGLVDRPREQLGVS